MATTNFLPRLFSPGRINGLAVANRLLMSSMHLNFEGVDQFARLAHFYKVRAKGGPGIIVTAGCSPDLRGCAVSDGFSIHSDEIVELHRQIVDTVHAEEGSRLALQLLHFGREAYHGQLVAPSPIRLEGNLFTPHALGHEEILEVISAYAQAARRAVLAGYDAVELVFSQGFLIHQFLSPHTNHRTDEWGGPFDRRVRFACEVAAAVRAEVGSGFPLIFRVPCLDMIEGGLTFEDSCALIEALVPFQIDLLNVSIGWHESDVPTIAVAVPQAGFASIAHRIKSRFAHLPVCVSNRINDARHAEELLAEKAADFIGMARPFLADRQFVGKSARGDFDAIWSCIACNQDCLDNVFQGKVVSCSVNPECSAVDEGQPPVRFPHSPEVAVVGGGAAGMACAVRLAERGARVTLFEKRDRLGGQLLLAARIPGKSEFASVVTGYEHSLKRLGVRIVQGHAFGLSHLHAARWAYVVVAVGTEANPWDPPPQSDARVLGFQDLLSLELPVEFPVLVLGGGGVATDVAKYLAARRARLDVSEGYLEHHSVERFAGSLPPLETNRREITIVQRSTKKLGYKLGRTTRWIMLDELRAKQVRVVRGASIESCAQGRVVLHKVDGTRASIDANTVVVCAGQHGIAEDLVASIRSAGIRADAIGAGRGHDDRPASISTSIRGGFDFANGIVL